MEKALEILKLFQSDKYKFESGAPLWKPELDSKMKEAIAELEEVMKPKTCDGCVYEDKDGVINVECAFCLRNSNDNFKPKDTQCGL